jgi:hypothetical protein
MAAPALIYDPRMHTFESWSALMCEAYATQQLQAGITEENWKDWAIGLQGIDVFQNEAIPNPYVFENWQDWAEVLVNVVNPRN